MKGTLSFMWILLMIGSIAIIYVGLTEFDSYVRMFEVSAGSYGVIVGLYGIIWSYISLDDE